MLISCLQSLMDPAEQYKVEMDALLLGTGVELPDDGWSDISSIESSSPLPSMIDEWAQQPLRNYHENDELLSLREIVSGIRRCQNIEEALEFMPNLTGLFEALPVTKGSITDSYLNEDGEEDKMTLSLWSMLSYFHHAEKEYSDRYPQLLDGIKQNIGTALQEDVDLLEAIYEHRKCVEQMAHLEWKRYETIVEKYYEITAEQSITRRGGVNAWGLTLFANLPQKEALQQIAVRKGLTEAEKRTLAEEICNNLISDEQLRSQIEQSEAMGYYNDALEPIRERRNRLEATIEGMRAQLNQVKLEIQPLYELEQLKIVSRVLTEVSKESISENAGMRLLVMLREALKITKGDDLLNIRDAHSVRLFFDSIRTIRDYFQHPEDYVPVDRVVADRFFRELSRISRGLILPRLEKRCLKLEQTLRHSKPAHLGVRTESKQMDGKRKEEALKPFKALTGFASQIIRRSDIIRGIDQFGGALAEGAENPRVSTKQKVELRELSNQLGIVRDYFASQKGSIRSSDRNCLRRLRENGQKLQQTLKGRKSIKEILRAISKDLNRLSTKMAPKTGLTSVHAHENRAQGITHQLTPVLGALGDQLILNRAEFLERLRMDVPYRLEIEEKISTATALLKDLMIQLSRQRPGNRGIGKLEAIYLTVRNRRNFQTHDLWRPRIKQTANMAYLLSHELFEVLRGLNTEFSPIPKEGFAKECFTKAWHGTLTIRELEEALDQGLSPNAYDYKGRTLFHCFADSGMRRDRALARRLFQRGGRPYAADFRQWTPLHYTAPRGHTRFARMLTNEMGVSSDAPAKDFRTACSVAQSFGSHRMARFLQKKVSKERGSRARGFLDAVENLDIQRARILRQQGYSARFEYGGQLPLVALFEQGGRGKIRKILRMAEILRRAGAQINQVASGNGNSALHTAASNHSDERLGCPNQEIAGSSRHRVERVVNYIATQAPDVFAVDSYGNTALHLSAQGGSLLWARMLLERGAQVDPRNSRGRTPLIEYAICHRRSHPPLVHFLLRNRADPSAESGYGSLLHHVGEFSGREVTRLILRYGGYPLVRGYGNRFPSEVAENEETRKLLLEYEAQAEEQGWPELLVETGDRFFA